MIRWFLELLSPPPTARDSALTRCRSDRDALRDERDEARALAHALAMLACNETFPHEHIVAAALAYPSGCKAWPAGMCSSCVVTRHGRYLDPVTIDWRTRCEACGMVGCLEDCECYIAGKADDLAEAVAASRAESDDDE